MKNIIYISIFIAGLFNFSCDEQDGGEIFADNTDNSEARVVVLNATPESPATNYRLTLDGKHFSAKASGYKTYPFKTFSKAQSGNLYVDYMGITPGKVLAFSNVSAIGAIPNSVVSFGGSFVAGKNYTAIAANNLAAIESVVIEDDLTPPSVGKAKIRFINLTPDNTTGYELLLNPSTTVFSAIAFKTATSFIEVAAGNYTVLLRRTGIATNYRNKVINIAEGKIITIYTTGLQSITSSSDARYVALNYMINKN